MTEDQIERAVEAKMDRLDRRYLNSPMTEAEYLAEVKAIHEWSDNEMRFVERSL